MLKNVIQLARPRHWIKNLIVLFPVIFALRMGDWNAWRLALLAMAAFCLVSSAAYIVNDIEDRTKDRLHPRKRNRPLASGAIGVPAAAAEAAVLFLLALAVAFRVGLTASPSGPGQAQPPTPLESRLIPWALPAIILAYFLLQVSYTFLLKRKMLVDVICIALGFVLRAVAGAVAIRVEVSPWLFVCTFTLCLFMGFCKRYSEVVTLADPAEAREHRPTLVGYTPELLTHLITLSAAIAVMSFLLYATSQRTVAHLGSDYLIYTIPVVIYAVCRFAMLSMNGNYADPTDLFLRDWPFQVTVAIWLAAVVAIILLAKGHGSGLGGLAW